jgi:hypothetical protein
MPDDLEAATAFGADQPERFLTAWFGPPARPAAEVPDELPEPLRRWHQLAGRWDRPLLRQNQIPAERQVDGDLLLVGIETQAVWLWGVDASVAVFERENTDGAEWTPTGEGYDEFLWHFVLVEAVFGGELGAGANNVAANGFPRLAATWAPIDVRPWRWPGPDHRLWVRDGVLAWTVVNDSPDAAVNESSYYSIFIGARSNDELVILDDLGIEWDWSSREDL